MNVFIGFMLINFIGGLLLWKTSLRRRSVLLLSICLFMVVAYYFLNQL